MSNVPRFARKETRQLAEEAEEAGFVYVGDDTKGHAQFVHAESGYNLSLSETPGRGQIKRVRTIIGRATGNRRGSFDREKQRQKQAALRDVLKRDAAARNELIEAMERRQSKAVWEQRVRAQVEARFLELRGFDFMMRSVPGHHPGRSVL